MDWKTLANLISNIKAKNMLKILSYIWANMVYQESEQIFIVIIMPAIHFFASSIFFHFTCMTTVIMYWTMHFEHGQNAGYLHSILCLNASYVDTDGALKLLLC